MSSQHEIELIFARLNLTRAKIALNQAYVHMDELKRVVPEDKEQIPCVSHIIELIDGALNALPESTLYQQPINQS